MLGEMFGNDCSGESQSLLAKQFCQKPAIKSLGFSFIFITSTNLHADNTIDEEDENDQECDPGQRLE